MVEAIMRLTAKDFQEVFQEQLSPWLKQRIKAYNFVYQQLSSREKEEYRLKIIKKISRKRLPLAGARRMRQWEKGWQENLNEGSIIPHYFGKYPVIRFKQDLIRPLSKNFEYHSLAVITDWLFEKYFAPGNFIPGVKEVHTPGMEKQGAVYEFGCGTGHNLLRVREINPRAEIWGLDWAKSSQKIVKRLGFKSAGFDLFRSDNTFQLKPSSIVFTVASLEQLGKRFKPIIGYWRKNQIKLCVNIEPINELLDKNNQWDKLSIVYAKKRNYLEGYLTYLRQLEKKGKIIIHRQQRTYIGSLFIDGYSVIVWSPVYGDTIN